MLPSGGSYVSLVSERGCGGAGAGAGAGAGGAEEAVSYTMVVQTMEHDMSACFKDTHPPFDVENQTVSFKLDSELLGKIGTQTLYARRTVLVGTDKFDPVSDNSLPIAFTLDFVNCEAADELCSTAAPSNTGGTKDPHQCPPSCPLSRPLGSVASWSIYADVRHFDGSSY